MVSERTCIRSGWYLSGLVFVRLVFVRAGIRPGWYSSGLVFVRAGIRPGWYSSRLVFVRAGIRPGWYSSRLVIVRAGIRPGWYLSGLVFVRAGMTGIRRGILVDKYPIEMASDSKGVISRMVSDSSGIYYITEVVSDRTGIRYWMVSVVSGRNGNRLVYSRMVFFHTQPLSVN